MKKITQSWNLTDKKEAYNMMNVVAEKMSNHVGERFELTSWAIIETTMDTGEVSYAFQCKTTEGEYLGTNSKSFLDGIWSFLAVFEPNELNTFEVGQARNKAGRPYLKFIA